MTATTVQSISGTAAIPSSSASAARLQEIQAWDESAVAEWLRSINSAGYATVFVDNNITGKSLLDCDQQALKELGITKVGDRVRILSSIRKLRAQCFELRKTTSIASVLLAELPPSGSQSMPGSPARDSPSTPHHSASASISTTLRNSPAAHTSSSTTATSSTRTLQAPIQYSPKRVRSPGAADFGLRPAAGSTSLLSNCVRFIGEEGQTRIVNISDCVATEQILEKALKKFGLVESLTNNPEHRVANYCVFVANEGSPPRLLDAEDLLDVCRDPSIPERERLILSKLNTTPSIAEIKQSHKIAQEQQELLRSTAMVNNISKLKKIGGFFGDLPSHIRGDSQNGLPSPIGSPMAPGSSGSSHGLSGSARGPKARIKEFFGGRPPSELISSNLQDYFPDASTQMLEKTVRNSIRRSQRMSMVAQTQQLPTARMPLGRRYSNASALSVSSSLHAVPTVGDAWINSTAVPRPRRPGSIYRAPSLYSVKSRRSVQSKRSLIKHDSQSPDLPTHLLQKRSGGSITGNDSNPVSGDDDDDQKSDTTFKGDDGISASEDSDVVEDIDGDEEEYDLPDYLKEKLASTEAEDITLDARASLAGIDGSTDLVSSIRAAEDTGPSLWHKGMLIGQGSFGSVVLGMNALTGELMAVKQVDLPRTHGDRDAQSRNAQMLRALQREIALLRDMQHDNVVQYLGSNFDDTHLNIFLEYVPGGSVSKMLADYGAFKEPLVRQFVRQILAGLSYLHGRAIIHRDIKGGNILVDNKGVIKISDFGISKKVEADLLSADIGTVDPQNEERSTRPTFPASSQANAHHRPSLQGSVYWMAPEVVRHQRYTSKADIWSLGCLIIEMFTARHPYPDLDQMQAIFRIGGGGGGFTSSEALKSPTSHAGAEPLPLSEKSPSSASTVTPLRPSRLSREVVPDSSPSDQSHDMGDAAISTAAQGPSATNAASITDATSAGAREEQLLVIPTRSNPSAPTIPSIVSTEAKDFLARTFDDDLARRPSAAALLDHPFCHPSVA
ncbi:ATP binding [Savitreella phatthalungensis]